MDADHDTPWGAHRVQSNGAITIPTELLQAIGLERGQRAHWILNPEMPGTLVLVPSALVSRAMPDIVAALKRHSS